ncbi:hypothetical protein FKM82_030790 [Ascaphus truei]
MYSPPRLNFWKECSWRYPMPLGTLGNLPAPLSVGEHPLENCASVNLTCRMHLSSEPTKIPLWLYRLRVTHIGIKSPGLRHQRKEMG